MLSKNLKEYLNNTFRHVLLLTVKLNGKYWHSYGCTGYIDLSKRRVSAEDIVKCEEKFAKARAVNSILRHVAERLDYTKAQLDKLYRKTAWHFDEKLKKVTAGHDIFKAAVT